MELKVEDVKLDKRFEESLNMVKDTEQELKRILKENQGREIKF
jgi:hypothetical protein